MAYSWKILNGNNYIAKASSGAIATAAGTLDAPKLFSANAFGVGLNVLAAGVYILPIGGIFLAQNSTIIADGLVHILGDGSTSQQILNLNSTNNSGINFTNIYFEQFVGINPASIANFTNCTFDFLSFNATNFSAFALGFYNCIFSNVGINTTYGGNNYVTNCLLINSLIISTANLTAINSYTDPTSGMQSGAVGFTNCNVDPATIITTNRGLKFGTGAWGNGQSQTGCTNCITQAPQFNGPTRFDFTLGTNSPHVALGIGPPQYGLGVSYTTNSTAGSGGTITTANTGLLSSLTGTTVPILGVGGDGFQLNSLGGMAITPTTGGTYVSNFLTGVLTLDSNKVIEMGTINFIGALNANTDFAATDPTAPDPRNNNVPDYNNGTSGGADRKPNYQTIRCRWSYMATPDVNNAAHWISGTTLVEVILGIKALYNPITFLGNGATAFSTANGIAILARTWQYELTSRNNSGV